MRKNQLTVFPNRKDAELAGKWFRELLAKGGKATIRLVPPPPINIQKYGAENPNTSGGVLAPIEIAEAIAETRDKVGIFRKLARVVEMASDNTLVPKLSSSPTGYYLTENAQITESQAGWDQVGLSTKKIACLTRCSSELVQDSAAFGTFIVQELAYTLEAMIDTAAFAADGTSTYAGLSGIRNMSSALAGYSLATSGNDTFAEFTAADFLNLVGLLPTRYHDNATWVMSPQLWAFTCLRLVTAVGYEDGRKTFFGYPVVLTSSMPGGNASTDFSNLVVAAFGDFSEAAMLGLRRDAKVFKSQSRYLEFDQIGLRATTRFDCVYHHLGDATAPGAVVVLAGN